MLTVCSVDMGQGIKKSFISNPVLRDSFIGLSDGDSIKKATRFKESCNPVVSRHPKYKETANAGIGLYFLKNLAKMHREGQLVIVSKKGYYYVDSTGKEIVKNMNPVEWPGTLVYLRVNLNETLKIEYQDLVMHI